MTTIYLYQCSCGNLKARENLQQLAPGCREQHPEKKTQLIGSIEIEEVETE